MYANDGAFHILHVMTGYKQYARHVIRPLLRTYDTLNDIMTKINGQIVDKLPEQFRHNYKGFQIYRVIRNAKQV